jgi:hypothetical protein
MTKEVNEVNRPTRRLAKTLLFKQRKGWNKTMRSLVGLLYFHRAASYKDLMKILGGRIPDEWRDWLTVFSGDKDALCFPVLYYDDGWKIEWHNLLENISNLKNIRVAYHSWQIRRHWRIFRWFADKAAIANRRFAAEHPEAALYNYGRDLF